MKNSVLVIFKNKLSDQEKNQLRYSTGAVAIAPVELKTSLELLGFLWKDLEEFRLPGSVHEASNFMEMLSRGILPSGVPIRKSFVYRGYDLWWIHHEKIYLTISLPYTQYKNLLSYLKDFNSVTLLNPPHKVLFELYLKAYKCRAIVMSDVSAIRGALPFGIFVQLLLTLLYLPILAYKRNKIMLFTSDFFNGTADYDFRMEFIYNELRKRNLSFVEFVRSLEPWRVVLEHTIRRRRPVIYTESLIYLGHATAFLTGGYFLAWKKFGRHTLISENDPEILFRLLVSTQYLPKIIGDVWAIRITKFVLRMIGVRASYVTAAVDRNFHTVIGCKLNEIPTAGIMHGFPTRAYTTFDFLPAFDGEKSMSVDKYGLWSDWWKEYYIRNSSVYNPKQLVVAGLMRPFDINSIKSNIEKTGKIRILYISEQLAVPSEVLPYLTALLALPATNFKVTIRFRPSKDGFKEWLMIHNPELLENSNIEISKGSLQDAISDSDVVVGSHSTAVLESLFQSKVPISFETLKWGDYFDLFNYDVGHSFYARNPDELIEKIKNAQFIPATVLQDLKEKYFGNPNVNGSAWVVNQLEEDIR